MKHTLTENRLLTTLKPNDLGLIAHALKPVLHESGTTLFEPADDVTEICFPHRDMIASLVLGLKEGQSAEAAIVGVEGALGGIISEGAKPAFAHGIIQIGGHGVMLSTRELDAAKRKSHTLRDHFARYADCLLAQVLQSVACNAVHELEARLARWLLSLHDRLGTKELHITQEFISQMLGVHRSYATRIVGQLERQGALEKSRGVIVVVNRRKLESQACECYSYLRRHFERVLPGVYP